MLSYQKQITEKAKFTYSTLGNAFEEQTKAIKNQQKKNEVKKVKSWWFSDKQLPSVKDFISNGKLLPEIIYVIEKIETKK